MNVEKICYQVVKITKKVGYYIRQQSKKISEIKVEKKGIHDFVTIVDKTAEKMLIDEFCEILPNSGFIAEENTSTKKGEKYNWIIDPLDGTTNFIHGLTPYCISVALQENNKTILGVIYEIGLDECFYSWTNSLAYLNGKQIKVTDVSKVSDSLIATGFPYYDYKRLPQFMESLQYFMKNSHGLRRLGSAAADLAYVAAGRFEAFYEYSLRPWDVAAGAFIVECAGGKVSDFDGKDNYLFGKEIIATNNNVYDEFLEIIKKNMNN